MGAKTYLYVPFYVPGGKGFFLLSSPHKRCTSFITFAIRSLEKTLIQIHSNIQNQIEKPACSMFLVDVDGYCGMEIAAYSTLPGKATWP